MARWLFSRSDDGDAGAHGRLCTGRGPLLAPLIGFALLANMGCAVDAPHLLDLASIEPAALEVRDELTVRGDGFSERTKGSLTFHGTVFRAGAEPRSVHIVVDTSAQSRQRLRMRVTEQLVVDFLGDDAVHHGTFRGSVTLAFAPRTAGAPPITGELTNLSLDLFRTPAASEVSESRPEQPEPHAQLLARYGWKVSRGGGNQFCLQDVNDEAEPSPLRRGDCILQFDDVNVFDARDLAPRPAARSAELLVVRQGLAAPQPVEVDVAGLNPQDAAGWRWGLGAGAILATLLLLGRSPVALGLALLESKLGRNWSASPLAARPSSWASVAGGLLPFLIVSALFAACGLGLVSSVVDYDLLLVYASSGALLCIAQFLGGGYRRKGWSPWQATMSVIRGTGIHLTVLIALTAAVLQHASLSLVEAASGQGGLPWQYMLFRSVGSYLAGCALMCSIVLLGVLHLGPHSDRRPLPPIRLTQVLLDTYLWVLSGLLVTAYLGGWQVPDLIAPLMKSQTTLGLLVFQTKLLAIFGAVVWLRRVLPTVSERTLAPVFWRWLLPLGLAGAALDLVWTSGSWPAWLETSSTWALVSGSVVALAALLNRIAAGRKAAAHSLAVNPWL